MRTVYYKGIDIKITPRGCIVSGKMHNGIGEAKKAAWRALKG